MIAGSSVQVRHGVIVPGATTVSEVTATDPGPPIVAALIGVLARRSSEDAAPRVAVVVDDRERPMIDELRRRRPDAVVVPVVQGAGRPRLHVQLAAHGPYDAVVDLLGRGSAGRRTHLLGHVRAGGGWVRRTPQGPETTWADRTAVAIIRDDEAAEVLALEPGRGRVLDTVPGEKWRVRSRLRTSGPLPVNPTPAEYDAPTMYLREYHDVVCLPRQLVLQRGLVLPETFTTVERHRQRNAFLTKTGVDFAEPPAGLDAAVPLRGRWFHLDNHMVGHFGHALSEQLSHLWGWRRARELDPSLGALVFTESGSLTEWQRDLLSAGGVDPEAVHVGAGPLEVETLVGCTPMFSRPAFVHPAILETYDAVGAALEARAGSGPRPRRLFLDRRSSKRACTNAEELVAEFTAAGFVVVHPEDHPLAEQVAMVRGAEVVAGFAGSAMFHVALAGRPTHVVVVGSESYPAHNEYLMSAVVGHRLDIVACQPEVPRVDGQFTRASFHSDFIYRPEREGIFLRSVLAELA